MQRQQPEVERGQRQETKTVENPNTALDRFSGQIPISQAGQFPRAGTGQDLQLRTLLQIPGKPRHKNRLAEAKQRVRGKCRFSTPETRQKSKHEYSFIELNYKVDHRSQAGQV